MTSKKALTKLFFDNKDIGVDIVLNDRKVCEIYNAIKFDLDRLEELEEAHDELFIEYCKYKNAIDKVIDILVDKYDIEKYKFPDDIVDAIEDVIEVLGND